MLKLLCLVSCKEEIECIKKQNQSTIFFSDILPYRQKYVIPGEMMEDL